MSIKMASFKFIDWNIGNNTCSPFVLSVCCIIMTTFVQRDITLCKTWLFAHQRHYLIKALLVWCNPCVTSIIIKTGLDNNRALFLAFLYFIIFMHYTLQQCSFLPLSRTTISHLFYQGPFALLFRSRIGDLALDIS